MKISRMIEKLTGDVRCLFALITTCLGIVGVVLGMLTVKSEMYINLCMIAILLFNIFGLLSCEKKNEVAMFCTNGVFLNIIIVVQSFLLGVGISRLLVMALVVILFILSLAGRFKGMIPAAIMGVAIIVSLVIVATCVFVPSPAGFITVILNAVTALFAHIILVMAAYTVATDS